MGTQQANQDESKKEILFPNGNRAQLVAPPAETSAANILHVLGIEQPKALLMIVGGAAGLDEELKSRLVQLFSRGIARAAADTGALIIDGGTQVGVMAMMGQGVVDRGRRSTLLGVAPAGKVTYPGGPAEDSIEDSAPLDPNHSHFVLVESNDWGGETDTLYELAEGLAKGVPAVTVLVNGGLIAKEEVLRSVRRGWPIIVIEGSRRLADEIATLCQEKPSFIDDPVMAEIIADGDFHLFSLDDPIAGLERMIIRQLSRHTTLRLVWERFALYDDNAKRQQISFNRLQLGILTLGVLGTLLVLSQRELGIQNDRSWQGQVLHYVIVIVPITVSILVAAANRFKAGNKWVLLRAGAEAIKREIFRYRAKAGIYNDQQMGKTSREAKLTREVESVSRQLMQTDVNLSALRPYVDPIPPKMDGAAADDDGFSFLTPDRYITIRLGDQLNFYRLKTTKLERQLKRLQWLIYISGGVGTLLAALGVELWIALTTALAAAFITYLEYQQIENTLMKYNQVATDLANVQAWWTALLPKEQADPKNVDKLVKHTEKILKGEHTGWVQRMENALAELYAQQTEDRREGEMRNKAG
ncbi:MAG: DUF4231 domain-containing protein [Candidatus Bipolaricaulia bacterium]